MSYKNLHIARKVKNDEFYTRYEDIEKEIECYRELLVGKTILMPCDDPNLLGDTQGLSREESSSQFWVYFHKNFNLLGLKKIIATHYTNSQSSYQVEYSGGNDEDITDFIKTPLKSNGDFRSPEVIKIMEQSDIVITNPPFSLFREFINQLISTNSKFIIIGAKGASVFRDVFHLIKQDKLWWGENFVNEFLTKSDGIKGVPATWYTNLHGEFTKKYTPLTMKYNPTKYPQYVNHKAINVDKVKDIPVDYFEEMGVPITFLKKYDPSVFEIISLSRGRYCTFTNTSKVELLTKEGLSTNKFSTPSDVYLPYVVNDKPPSFKHPTKDIYYKSIYIRLIIKRRSTV